VRASAIELAAALAALLSIGCGTSGSLDRSGAGRTTSEATLAQVPIFGHRVDVHIADLGAVRGELLAVDAESIFLALGERQGVVAIPRAEASRVAISLEDDATGALTGWSIAGLLTSPSHGLFAAFSGPLWVLVGAGTSAAEGFSVWTQVAPDGFDTLFQFARFPAGPPPSLVEALYGRAPVVVEEGHREVPRPPSNLPPVPPPPR
jgi:hypothetical protein